MTIEEFLAVLEKTPRDWERGTLREIRRERDGFYGRPCCPVSACHPGGARPSWDYPRAAELLGLSDLDARRIAMSADDARDSEYFDPALRALLLEACGLPLETRA